VSIRARWRGAAIAFALLGAGAASARLGEGFAARLSTIGPDDMARFAVLQIAVAATGIMPASLIAVAAGASFGITGGFLLCACGTMVGGVIAFLMARGALRPWIARRVARYPAFARLDDAVASGDWKIACLVRLSPIMPFAATSYGLGLTRMTLRSFVLGMVASLPALLGYVSLGALGKAGLTGEMGAGGWFSGLMLGVGAAATLALTAYLHRLVKREPGTAAV
jgi:uncharacterized membrane protein YdjX (TVP38/TMEM64 family)